MELEEKKLSSEEIFDGVAIHLFRDEILLPNGNKGVREVIRHPGAVCVIPVTEDGDVIFVNQFRYAFNKVTLEVPAGKLEKGEDPFEAGKRELEEETGCVAAKYHTLGKFYPTPGYCGEIIYLYAAEKLSETHMHPDDDEYLEVERIPLEKAVDMVLSGEIKDGKTQVLILRVAEMKRRGIIG